MRASKLRRSFLLLFPLACLLAPVQQAARAQGNDCPGNLVQNGGFTNGNSPGPMPSGAVSSWAAAYGTPDVAAGQGCQDPGFVGMWGNQNAVSGEALHQVLPTALVSGKTYLVSFCARRLADPKKQPVAAFRVRASTATLSSWTGTDLVGVSPVSPSTSWTPIHFIWTAPVSSLDHITISVENSLNINDGSKTSYGHVDNICIQELDFTASAVCQGQPTVFSSNATGIYGVNSWNWTFGDSTAPSGQQNPTHTYANAGTYNVTLCVNGSTTNCVTKPVTVNPKPPAPAIIGPSNLCGGLQATYSVAAVNGVSYAWAVSGGTITSPPTGSSVGVTWSSTGGTISVTATNQQGCSSRVSMQVFACNVGLSECCHFMNLNASAPTPVHIANNVYALTPTLTLAPGPITRVVANVISTERIFSSATCGANGPVSSHIVNATSPAPPAVFTPSLPVAFSHEVIWNGPPQSLGAVAFPFQIQFPARPSLGCSDTLKFCVKYTSTLSDCRSCEIIKCYSVARKGKIWWPSLAEEAVRVGRPFTVAVEVEAPGPLVLGIKPGTGARGARLEGRTAADVADGRATFLDVVIDKAGRGYVLVVSGPGLPEPIESDPFAVSQETPRR